MPASGPAQERLVTRLLEAKETVLELWEQRARRMFPAAHLGRLTLLDGLPSLLEEVAGELSRKEEASTEDARRSESATGHGRQRATVTSFSLDEVLAEYELLRQVLFEVLEASDATLGPEEREALLTRLELRIRAAAIEFARVRQSELREARDELEKSNELLERKVHEQTTELTTATARFRVLVEGVKDYAILTLDPSGYISSWNAGAERMNGYTAQEAIGHHFSMLYPEGAKLRDEPMAHLRSAAIEGRFRGEGVRLRKNGDLFLADVLITPMYDGKALAGFSKVVQDLTERNALIQERDLLRSDAERLRVEASYRERFVAALTHDLRSPLSVARMAADLIARTPDQVEQVRRAAQRIASSVDRADRMLVDLLDVSRVDAGHGLTVELAQCDLLEIAKPLLSDFKSHHGERLVLLPEGDLRGIWNADALHRVLDNLLSNALKYGDPDKPITVRLRRTQNRVLVMVHNHGTIIPVAEQAKLFQPYHRTNLAEVSGKPGWGLGLTLVRGIVAAHNGQVKVESYPTEGTTFTVDLPVDPRA